MKKLIDRLKRYRRHRLLHTNFRKQYAFIGIGHHSLHQLHPILKHFGLPLKYIITKSKESAAAAQKLFPQSCCTNDLDLALYDEDVFAVFICTQSEQHYSLVKKALQAGKHVFVEKPPCQNLQELQDLIRLEKQSKGSCMVGLQKRYTPVYQQLKKSGLKNGHYSYHYQCGAYPEGDELIELFIHPLDLVHYLFGKAQLKGLLYQKNKAGLSILLQLRHENNMIGQMELSSNYSWTQAEEKLSINTNEAIWETKNCKELSKSYKPRTLFQLPLEKLIAQKEKKELLWKHTEFSPTLEQNTLYTMGYYKELDSFIRACEKGQKRNRSSLEDCLPTHLPTY
jgi:virulence factor